MIGLAIRQESLGRICDRSSQLDKAYNGNLEYPLVSSRVEWLTLLRLSEISEKNWSTILF